MSLANESPCDCFNCEKSFLPSDAGATGVLREFSTTFCSTACQEEFEKAVSANALKSNPEKDALEKAKAIVESYTNNSDSATPIGMRLPPFIKEK